MDMLIVTKEVITLPVNQLPVIYFYLTIVQFHGLVNYKKL